MDEESLYAQAAAELESDNRDEGLWAKCFAESDGDENKAKAQYLKIRVKRSANLDITEAKDPDAIEANVEDKPTGTSPCILGGIFGVFLAMVAMAYMREFKGILIGALPAMLAATIAYYIGYQLMYIIRGHSTDYLDLASGKNRSQPPKRFGDGLFKWLKDN